MSNHRKLMSFLFVVSAIMLWSLPVLGMPPIQGEFPEEIVQEVGRGAQALSEANPVIEFSLGGPGAQFSLEDSSHIGFLVKTDGVDVSFSADARLRDVINWNVIKSSFVGRLSSDPIGAVQGLVGYLSTVVETAYVDPNAGDPVGLQVEFVDPQAQVAEDPVRAATGEAGLDVSEIPVPAPPAKVRGSLSFVVLAAGIIVILSAAVVFVIRRRRAAQEEEENYEEDLEEAGYPE